LSTPLIIQLNGYFAIVTERVAGGREVQNNPSKANLCQKKKILHPSESRYKNSSKGGNWVTVFKGRIALLIQWK
tara:strand:+ start:368 stop:589 length:222 start_codon:yes stop_codon:yes gene_type:complete